MRAFLVDWCYFVFGSHRIWNIKIDLSLTQTIKIIIYYKLYLLKFFRIFSS